MMLGCWLCQSQSLLRRFGRHRVQAVLTQCRGSKGCSGPPNHSTTGTFFRHRSGSEHQSPLPASGAVYAYFLDPRVFRSFYLNFRTYFDVATRLVPYSSRKIFTPESGSDSYRKWKWFRKCSADLGDLIMKGLPWRSSTSFISKVTKSILAVHPAHSTTVTYVSGMFSNITHWKDVTVIGGMSTLAIAHPNLISLVQCWRVHWSGLDIALLESMYIRGDGTWKIDQHSQTLFFMDLSKLGAKIVSHPVPESVKPGCVL